MARITVEDCILKIPNRFDLVMLAAQRARDISAGAALTVDRDNDKNPVVALREIAESTVDLDHLRYEVMHGLRRHLDVEPDQDAGALSLELEGTQPAEPYPGPTGVYAEHEVSEEEVEAEEDLAEPLPDELDAT